MRSAKSIPLNRRLIAAVTTCLFALPTAASAVTWNITSANIDGTIVYASAGDSEPTSFSITDGASIWTEADPINVPFASVWAGSVLTEITPSIADDISPNATFATFSAISCCTVQVNFPMEIFEPYSLTLQPPPPVPSLQGYGIALLSSLIGLAAVRKLRA